MYYSMTLKIKECTPTVKADKVNETITKYKKFLEDCKNKLLTEQNYTDERDYIDDEDIPDLIVFPNTQEKLIELLTNILLKTNKTIELPDIDYITFKQYLIQYLIKENLIKTLKGTFTEGVSGGSDSTYEYYSFEYATIKTIEFNLNNNEYTEKIIYPTL